MKRVLLLLLLIRFVISPEGVAAQNVESGDSTFRLSSTHLKYIGMGASALYAGSMTGLYILWYKDYPLSNFHQFNDNKEWLQMDKLGHATTSYYISFAGIKVMEWAGMSHKKAVWWGVMPALLFQTNIEVFDGFAPKWGFSWGDIAANFSGAGLAASQALLWNEQRIKLKFSFHRSDYYSYRPNLLGKNLQENIIKDYNGQTYWLSINVKSFFSSSSKLPSWLNVALGYGADGMISARANPAESNDPNIPYIKRYRQYYLGLDIDLTKIKTRSRILNTAFSAFGFIKIPAPALELTEGGILKFYPFYF